MTGNPPCFSKQSTIPVTTGPRPRRRQLRGPGPSGRRRSQAATGRPRAAPAPPPEQPAGGGRAGSGRARRLRLPGGRENQGKPHSRTLGHEARWSDAARLRLTGRIRMRRAAVSCQPGKQAMSLLDFRRARPPMALPVRRSGDATFRRVCRPKRRHCRRARAAEAGVGQPPAGSGLPAGGRPACRHRGRPRCPHPSGARG